MKVDQRICVFLFLTASVVCAQQPVFSSSTSANQASTAATNNSQTPIKISSDAAEHGDADEQYLLGLAYETGSAGTTNYAEAVKWYLKAAQQGIPEAQNNLGWIYLNGYGGVSKNVDEGVKWLTKAAENGNMQASGRLAFHYLFGENKNENKNIQEALRWFRFGAGRGDVSLQKSLALFLKDGNYPFNDVEKDPNEAAKWYLRAAKQGDGDAQVSIGAMFAEGSGVSQDFVESYKWFNIAAASSEKQAAERAKTARDNIAQQMTPDQIAAAQQLARKFKPHKESDSSKSTPTENATASGTGFFITADGYLISNNHVVEGATKVRVVTSAGIISAKVVRVDAANDLALLKAEGRFASLPLTASRGVKLGGTVATVGFPNIGLQGFAPKLAKGEIASLSGAGDDARYFQISVPVQPGNSGGALVDERGNVVGVVSAKLSAKAALAESGALPENVNYAVKSSFLLSFLESVPDVASKLKEPKSSQTAIPKFEDVVKDAERAAVLVLVY